MTSTVPFLSSGCHGRLTDGACAMEMVAYLAGEKHGDRPVCTHPVLAELARKANDLCGEFRRQEIAPMLPSLIGTNDGDGVVNVRLAAWVAREVMDLIKDEHLLALSIAAIRAAEAWCDDPTDANARAARSAGLAIEGVLGQRPHADEHLAAKAAALSASFQPFQSELAARYATRALTRVGSSDELPALLRGAIAEHRRLTGHRPPAADDLDWAGLKAAMGR